MQQYPQAGQPVGAPGGGAPMGGPPAEEPKTSGLAIAGLIVGILGWLCCLMGPMLNFVGSILSIIGLVQIKNNPQTKKGKGMAIAAIIVNIAGFIIISIALILGAALGVADEIIREL